MRLVAVGRAWCESARTCAPHRNAGFEGCCDADAAAQARLPKLVREAADQPITITRHDKVVGFLLSPERMQGIVESLEIMANPEAMKQIRRARGGRGSYRLRVGRYRVVFRCAAKGRSRVVRREFAEERSLVYQIFAELVRHFQIPPP
jgi:hypothetical protein